jgi:hypothetical protein
MISKRKPHSIISNALSISILKAMSPPLPLLDLRELRSSWAKIVISQTLIRAKSALIITSECYDWFSVGKA